MGMTMTRNRRRLLNATIVVLFLGGTCWWLTRPRIDRRLVGTWLEQHSSWDRKLYWHFRSDGTGDCTTVLLDESQRLGPDPFCWSADGITVHLFELAPSRFFPVKILGWIERISGFQISILRSDLPVAAIEHETIRLRSPSGSTYEWQRVAAVTPLPQTNPPASKSAP
jgi:hypothetical protein